MVHPDCRLPADCSQSFRRTRADRETPRHTGSAGVSYCVDLVQLQVRFSQRASYRDGLSPSVSLGPVGCMYREVDLTTFAICARIASIGWIPPYRAFSRCCLITTLLSTSRDEATMAAQLSSADDSIPRTRRGVEEYRLEEEGERFPGAGERMGWAAASERDLAGLYVLGRTRGRGS